MSEKRRDNKGRLLRQGELQRSDGKYEYRYVDVRGERHSIYSWKLVDTDKLPNGKRDCRALRDLEKEIQHDISDGVDSYRADRTTLNCYFDDYIETKHKLKSTTRAKYKYKYSKYVRDNIGNKNLSSIKFSDVKKFYIKLLKDYGLKPGSINTINSIIHPVFSTAVRDGLIRTNPVTGALSDIKKSSNCEETKRHALTEAQQAAFIEYVKNSKTYSHWLTLYTVMLGTGCRVGEATGLRWQDCDFEENVITIDHTLTYCPQEDGSGSKFIISTTKTKAGIRVIPMLKEVREALLAERARQTKNGFNQTVVDGYSGFIFTSRHGGVLSSFCVNSAILHIIARYNKMETERAKEELRQPELLPHFTAHNLRHTFCTRFCENETNLKVIQEIMGHSNISTTMDVYNEATKEKKMESFSNLEGKIKIS